MDATQTAQTSDAGRALELARHAYTSAGELVRQHPELARCTPFRMLQVQLESTVAALGGSDFRTPEQIASTSPESDEAGRIARKIMLATDNEHDGPIVTAALWRCVAEIYARIAYDAGDPAATAGMGLMITASEAAELATQLCHAARASPGHRAN
jgi:hypothetical protein